MKENKIQIQWLDPNSLTPYARNTKKHPTKQVDKIAQQIAAHGFDQPIVVDKDKVIIKGHGRREASLRLGLKAVPVVVRDDLNEYEVMAARIGDNKVAESEWDEDMLKFEIGTLQGIDDFDLNLTGMELNEIDKLMNEQDEMVEEDDDKPAEENPPQFIVAVNCGSEPAMKQVYDEMVSRGLECKLIT